MLRLHRTRQQLRVALLSLLGVLQVLLQQEGASPKVERQE